LAGSIITNAENAESAGNAVNEQSTTELKRPARNVIVRFAFTLVLALVQLFLR
jgi:hypothetical protein